MTSPDTTAGIQDAARHLAEGRPDEAVAALEQLLRSFPSYVTAHVLLAKASEAAGDPDRALDAWNAAYFLMPTSSLVLRERQRLLHIDVAPVGPSHGEPTPAEPPSGEVPEAATAESPEAEPEAQSGAEETVVGAAPDEWVAGTEMPEPEAPPEPTDPGQDWQIIEETGGGQPPASTSVEPAVAPPPGHRGRSGTTEAAAGQSADDDPESSLDPEAAFDSGERAGASMTDVDDLDTLIEQLENAPRIRPDPEFRSEDVEPEGDDGELVSETLARIYETQGQYAEAARAYARLAEQQPARADEFYGKADAMRRRAAGQGG